jgi:hypothetical protein
MASCLNTAIEHLARPENKDVILGDLANDRDLAQLVVKFGWQADARSTLLAGFEQEKRYLPPDWITAVAMLQDPATYPALEAYLINGENKGRTFDAIKQLPGIDLTNAVDAMWRKARYGDPNEIDEACDIAAQYGHSSALETAATILKKETNRYQLDIARGVITKYTSATGNDAALAAWVEANHDKLVFDAQSKKFVVRN